MSDEFGEVRYERLSINELADAVRNQPVRHDQLPDALLVRIKDTYDTVGHLMRTSLEQWELGFMKDTHPEGEVKIWERIGAAFKLYCEQHGTPDVEMQRKLVGSFCMFVHGGEPDNVASPVRRKLRECWKAVN